MTKIIIIGSGLTGLFASILAAERGADVILAMKGRGGLALSNGCIDVLDRSAPSRALSRLPDNHPYKLAGRENLKDALSRFTELMTQVGYPYAGKLSKSMPLLTALGTIRRTCFAPSAIARGDISAGEPIVLGSFAGLRDFYPAMVQRQARKSGVHILKTLELPLLDAPSNRDAYFMDIALRFEDPAWRSETIRMWRPLLPDVKLLGLPAIIGFLNHQQILHELEDSLGIHFIEIPSLPPSIPGLRVEHFLLRHAQGLGVRIIEGAGAIGRVDGRSKGKRVAGVVLRTAGRSISLDADVVLLATGGVLNGGLVAQQDHRIRESVFALPVHYPTVRSDWVGLSIFDGQPYASAGIRVNPRMQPLGPRGKPLFSNLFAAGGLLAGSDQSVEGSRQGIDLTTAYCAVCEALN